MPKEWEIAIPEPADISNAEQERLIQAAINKKFDRDVDDMLKGFG